jgi:hypothetical protein
MDNQFHVSTDEQAESLPESILKATVMVLPVVLQLLTLFRRPKAATATVSLATSNTPASATSTQSLGSGGQAQ